MTNAQIATNLLTYINKYVSYDSDTKTVNIDLQSFVNNAQPQLSTVRAAFTSADRYYVNVKVHHASDTAGEYSSFQGGLLEVNPASLQTDPDTGLRYVEFDFTNWLTGAGESTSSTFTGNEEYTFCQHVRQR